MGGELYELAEGDKRAHWGRVTAWEPPRRLVISWHVNPETAGPTEFEVTFTPEGEGTRVELEHRNWEAAGDGAAEMRDRYDGGWDIVLAPFVGGLGRPSCSGRHSRCAARHPDPPLADELVSLRACRKTDFAAVVQVSRDLSVPKVTSRLRPQRGRARAEEGRVRLSRIDAGDMIVFIDYMRGSWRPSTRFS